MISLIKILNETNIEKYKTWYHVTPRYLGDSITLLPKIPNGSRLPYEDKHTPRISVTHNWRSGIYMLIVIHQSREWFVYSTKEKPIDPISYREDLIRDKKIKKNSNLFRSIDAEKFGIEAWFLEPVNFKLAGVVDIGKNNYLGLRMSMGFGDGGINYKKLKLKNVAQYKEEIRLKKEKDRKEMEEYSRKTGIKF